MTSAIQGRATVDRAASERELEHILREHAGRLATALVRITGDFAMAEDLVQDAVLAALQRWPTEGVPDRLPGCSR
jgi:predicted RNA polymerase sigma factor